MSTRQTAVINGLLAENYGKNDLIRSAESRSRDAESKANDMERRAKTVEIEAEELAYEVRKLKKENEKIRNQALAAQQEAEKYRQLLSLPMKEIAEINGDFKKAYDQQQQLLAEWIMGQKAYRETAMQLGSSLDMTPEQIQKIAAPNFTAVLENRTQHGNNANDGTPTLANHAANILALRKKNGKA